MKLKYKIETREEAKKFVNKLNTKLFALAEVFIAGIVRNTVRTVRFAILFYIWWYGVYIWNLYG